MKRRTALCALLSTLLLLCGCIVPLRFPAGQAGQTALSAQQSEDLKTLLRSREDGVNKKDEALFLSTVLPSDACLYKEESSLIRSAKGLDISDYTLSASSSAQTKTGMTAVLRQSYTLAGIKHTCSYKAAFALEDGKLYYCGPAFSNIGKGGVSVCYADGQQNLAQKLLGLEIGVLSAMKDKYGYTPAETVVIKIYDDQQVFLQSVKFDLPDWVGGWHEYKEAIKVFNNGSGSNLSPDSEYLRLLRHETTHLMLSELSSDNAAYWLQEGMAGIDETALGTGAAPYMTKSEFSESFTPYATHKNLDLESFGEQDSQDVTIYYATSKAYAAFLLDQYGWTKMNTALTSMQKHPYLPVTSEEKLSQCTNYTDEALRLTYGFASDTAFQSAFDAWLTKQGK